MFNPQAVTERYQPRPGDASLDIFHARMRECARCPLRQIHRCRIANQLVSVLARPAGAVCPNRSWPGDSPVAIDEPITAVLPKRTADFPAVAVVIICHNYGRYLAEATESVLAQTVRPAEIVIVDDASTDDTADVAVQFANRGVRTIRIENGDPHQAQAAGFRATQSPIICFLDADDILPADYLLRGLPAFTDPHVGIVYSDMEKFGDEAGRLIFPPSDQLELAQQNRCHAGSLVRRAALEISGAFDDEVSLPAGGLQDWYLWRRVVESASWKLAKSPALYRYRRHGTSFLAEARKNKASYFELAALERETITLFIPLSGRLWAWPETREFLERHTWPPGQIRLVLCDTSCDPMFSQIIREWLSECEYPDTRYYRQRVGDPGVADQDRYDSLIRCAVQAAMPRIYNRMAREATTEYVWIVEDDVIPPLDAAALLLRGFDENVASVSGAYRSRFHAGYVAWDRNGKPIENADDGLSSVAGNGFGCVILRRSVLTQTVLQHVRPTPDYDPNFYHWLSSTRWRARLDWRIECEHLDQGDS
jgi:hypothetical protein